MIKKPLSWKRLLFFYRQISPPQPAAFPGQHPTPQYVLKTFSIISQKTEHIPQSFCLQTGTETKINR
jgi:hypothetical protein